MPPHRVSTPAAVDSPRGRIAWFLGVPIGAIPPNTHRPHWQHLDQRATTALIQAEHRAGASIRQLATRYHLCANAVRHRLSPHVRTRQRWPPPPYDRLI
jgi:hypothetical protein